MSSLIVGRLDEGSPDRTLAAVMGRTRRPHADVIAFPGERTAPSPSTHGPIAGKAFQVKVTLLDIEPPIWRRVIVDGRRTLDHLHDVIQCAFGWSDHHLHEFEIGSTRYALPDPDDDWDEPPQDERRTRLDAVAGEGSSFRYTYDFGDGWDHEITVEGLLAADTTPALPSCIDGGRACPPEDCGGTWGYRELLEILAHPAHPEHDERREWIGRPFDPEAFDPSEFEDNLRSGRRAAFDDA
jgi:hypothetical protein